MFFFNNKQKLADSWYKDWTAGKRYKYIQKSEFTFTILRQRQHFRRNTQRKRESYNAKKMLALPSNPDSYELNIRFFFFLKLLKFLIVNETWMFVRMSLSRTCQLNVCVIFLLFQWQFPAFVPFVLWPVCDKLEHALKSFA